MIHYVTQYQFDRATLYLEHGGDFFTPDEIAIADLLKHRQPVHVLVKGALYRVRTGSQEYPEEITAIYISISEAGDRFHRFKTNGAKPGLITVHEHAILKPFTNEAAKPKS